MSYSEDNKLQGDINAVFKPDQQRWDRNELEVISEINKQYLRKTEKADEYFERLRNKLDTQGISILPHQKSIEVIIYDARKFLIELMDIISNEENPYDYIVSSQENIFSFTLIMIILGVIIFIISSFMSE
tara:strand:- start:2372 stop:2761 length:390 start_codon:yes stop_codon:yes gene_type:complete